jgi:hypothetical protein
MLVYLCVTPSFRYVNFGNEFRRQPLHAVEILKKLNEAGVKRRPVCVSMASRVLELMTVRKMSSMVT